MAKLQHVYRRGHVFWWRRIHHLFSGFRVDIRLSLRTCDRLEARDRGAALSAMRGQVISMLEQRIVKAADARPTEDELQAIACDAYQDMLARICDDQRRSPYHAVEHSIGNRVWADYYDRLSLNGGHIPMVVGEEEALAKAGWNNQRIEGLRTAIDHVLAGNQPISRHLIDSRLREYGYEPHNALRDIVERVLYPAYRDACVEAEQRLQRMRPQPQAERLRHNEAVGVLVSVPSEAFRQDPDQLTSVASVQPELLVPDDTGQTMSDFIEQALHDLAADEKWDAKSGRQARSTVALFELLIGKKPFAEYSQLDFAAFKRKTLLLGPRAARRQRACVRASSEVVSDETGWSRAPWCRCPCDETAVGTSLRFPLCWGRVEPSCPRARVRQHGALGGSVL